jgi:hypothetical protein
MQNCAEDQGMVTMMGKRVINWIFMGVLDVKRNLRKFRFQFNLVSWILWAFEVFGKGVWWKVMEDSGAFYDDWAQQMMNDGMKKF